MILQELQICPVMKMQMLLARSVKLYHKLVSYLRYRRNLQEDGYFLQYQSLVQELLRKLQLKQLSHQKNRQELCLGSKGCELF